jgi:maltooligosyltrehalose trehalohydrolase
MTGPTDSEQRNPRVQTTRRRIPVGAEPLDIERTHFRVWAPAANQVDVVGGSDGALASTALAAEGDGYFSGVASVPPGGRYRYRLNDGETLYPDPVSRYQPDGPHGASVVVDAAAFRWTDSEWSGVSRTGQVVYELHPGTFTTAGTWAAAAEQLAELAGLGITVIELMPVAEFEGRFGWGYDGVDLFAPSHLYGTPDQLREFIDRAHRAGIGVILDVVYNHMGPVGNYLRAYSPAYFTDRYANEWGEAINFDGPDAGPVREFFTANAAYWIDEFHFDGLRVDATQQIFDASAEHILKEIAAAARRAAAPRSVYIVAENEAQHPRLARASDEGGFGLDALWNDDFHHSAMVALTGQAEAYYSDTSGAPQEIIAAAKYGYLFQGQHYSWQKNRRGMPGLDLDPSCFVNYLQNHDQVANAARGLRGHQLASPARWRAMTAVLLLLPGTPMLFQGQEFAASAPFLFFVDFDDQLSAAVRKGRAEFLMQFPSIVDYLATAGLSDPAREATFRRCKLDFAERTEHAAAYTLHRDLLALRRGTAVLHRQQPRTVDGTVLSAHAFALRFLAADRRDDRLLVVNLGAHLDRKSVADPLVAPPEGCHWMLEWSSEQPKYGGNGTRDIWAAGAWSVPGDIALVFAPRTETMAAAVRRGE